MSSPEELLRPCLAKIQRAEQHINCLNGQINAYLAHRPVRLVTRGDAKTGEETHFIKAEVPIPDALSLVLGDAVHNLRAALDILVFSMIGAKATKPHRVEFPIRRIEADFVAALKGGEIQLAGKNVVSELKALQPYEGGDKGLYELHTLDIADKHRLILTTIGTASMTSREFVKLVPLGVIGIDSVTIVMSVGTAIAVQPPDGTRLQRRAHRRSIRVGEYERDRQPAFHVSFGEGQPFASRPVVPIMMSLTNEVKDCCVRIADAFFKP